MFELRGIDTNFGAVRALVGVDFQLARNEVVALVGDNGAGKSTLLSIMAGVRRPSGGSMFVQGRPVDFRGR